MKKYLKRLIVLMMVVILAFTACEDIDDPYYDDPTPSATQGASTPSPTQAGNNDPSPTQSGNNDPTPTSAADLLGDRSMLLSVNSTSGELQVNRKDLEQAAGRELPEGWTLFVYLCGTDLESEYEAATPDLLEMQEASTGDKVRFIVETGGANEWYNDTVKADKLQRFLIQNGEIKLLDEQKIGNMGKPETLEAFLEWGLKDHASAHNGLIFWNHGGGSVTGVCFDERYDNDSLDLTELDSALNNTIGLLGKKFDFIGFDACLMGTVETANILATFADYMYGSQEVEPGSGWDYVAIGNFLGGNSNADGLALGKKVADSFLAACKREDEDEEVTFSIIDLSKMDDLLVSFNNFAKDLYDAAGDTTKRADIVRAIGEVDDFGGNNRIEGYTNMVDLGGIINACGAYSSNADAAYKALKATIAYSVSGSMHTKASGLSTYYPIRVQGSNELSTFGKVCISPYYLSFVDMLGSIGASGDMNWDYDDDIWFDDDGEWFWGDDWDYFDDDYWNYYDEYDETGESPYITFDVEPTFEDGWYFFRLDEDGLYSAADVYGIVYVMNEDGSEIIEYGETYDIDADWETGTFFDNFTGLWVSLPDGQNLATYIVDYGEDYIIYTSPVKLNGRETNLRLKLTEDSIVIEGAWDGIGESGASSRDIVKLKPGDRIVPLYYSYPLYDDDDWYEDDYGYYGDEYVFDGEPEVYYDYMYPGEYLYAFVIEDIYGDYYMTEFETFYINEEGEVEY